MQRLTSPTTINPTSAFSSLAAYALNSNSGGGGGGVGSSISSNNNSITFGNKNLYSSSVTQFLNQSIYEPIEDDDLTSSFPSAESIASAFNYEYYQSQTSMDPETSNAFESQLSEQGGGGVAVVGGSKHLADVAEAHEQSLKLFRESFDLGNVGQQSLLVDVQETKKKHKKSKKLINP